MCASIQHRQMPVRHGCLRRFGGGAQPAARLVCFPWCGAGASVYRRFAPGLPDTIELLAVQLPGREDRFGEAPLVSMDSIVQEIVKDLVPLCDRTLVLFGHSMGAVVAHETALALRQRIGREPDLLIVSGYGAPSVTAFPKQQWHLATDKDLVGRLRELGGTPEEILSERHAMQSLLPVVRADYEALETHMVLPLPPLSCPIVVCTSDGDSEVTRNSAEAWRAYTDGAFHVQQFEGNHFYLYSQPRVLTRKLAAWIADMTPPASQHTAYTP